MSLDVMINVAETWVGITERPAGSDMLYSMVASQPGRDPGDGFRLDAVRGVADLDLDGPPETALYELLRLDDDVWRHGFVAYLRHRHKAGSAGDTYPPGVALEGYFAVASEARVLRKTKAVIEGAHRGRVLSLAELARAGEGLVEDRRKREVGLRDRVLWPMDELGAWDVTEVPRMAGSGATRPGVRGVSRYEIGAGPALIAFDALHYRFWLLHQLGRLNTILGRWRGRYQLGFDARTAYASADCL